jgi:hypothetical protein
MLILENILFFQYKKMFFEKNNFPKISALFFWNYFMPNLLVGYGICLQNLIPTRCVEH